MSKFWEKPVYECGADKSIKLGFLCDFVVRGSGMAYDLEKYNKFKREYTAKEQRDIYKQDKLKAQLDEVLFITKQESRKKVAIIVPSIEMATRAFDIISKTDEVVVIHSKLKNANDLIEEYKLSDVVYSVSVAMIQEGFDCPKLDCVVLLIASKSTRKVVQIIGRGLRIYPGKDYCLVLDYGYCVINTGGPKNPIVFGDKKSESSESEIFQCQTCFYIYEEKGPCPSCGCEKEIVKRDVEKNLLESINEEKKFVIFTRENIIKNSRTIKGSRFISLASGGVYISLFGLDYRKFFTLLKQTGSVKIMYSDGGKYAKCLAIQRHQQSEPKGRESLLIL